MRKFFIICAILVSFVFSTVLGFAKIEIPGRTSSWVNDYAGIIDKDTKDYLEKLISSIEQRTPDTVEVIIATFRSLQGWNFEEFAREYGEKWRLVKRGRRDNGVMLVVVLDQARVAIGAGQNLKGVLTEAMIRDITQNTIIPEFRKGDYAKGIKKGTETIVKILTEAEISADEPMVSAKVTSIAILIILALFLIKRFFKKRDFSAA